MKNIAAQKVFFGKELKWCHVLSIMAGAFMQRPSMSALLQNILNQKGKKCTFLFTK